MFKTDVTHIPHTVTVRITAAPVLNILSSMMLFNLTEVRSGLGDFIVQTAAAMPAALKEDNEVATHLINATDSHVHEASFPDYIDYLAQADFGALILSQLEAEVRDHPEAGLTAQALLDSQETYIAFIESHYQAKGVEMNPAIYTRLYGYLTQPERAREFLVNHLRTMWEQYLRDEWPRVLPTIEESVRLIEQLELSDLTALEAVQAITGRDMTGFISDDEDLEEIVFIPSVHSGPYVTRFDLGKRKLGLVFGARLPEGVSAPSVELSLRDLLIQLNALADDTRLHILELLTHHRELCSTDFQQMLNLSQSSVSRHLRQLVASGYLDERRRELNKYFSLNTRRIHETSAALKLLFTRRG